MIAMHMLAKINRYRLGVLKLSIVIQCPLDHAAETRTEHRGKASLSGVI